MKILNTIIKKVCSIYGNMTKERKKTAAKIIIALMCFGLGVWAGRSFSVRSTTAPLYEYMHEQGVKVKAFERYYNATEHLLDILQDSTNWIEWMDKDDYYAAVYGVTKLYEKTKEQ